MLLVLREFCLTSRSRGTGYAPVVCALATPIVAQTTSTAPLPLTLRYVSELDMVNMNRSNEIIECQNDLVVQLSKLAPREWTMVVLNTEIVEGSSGSPICDRVCYWVHDKCGEIHTDNISLTPEVVDIIIYLRNLFEKYQDEKWDICDLTIGSNGKYEFKFNYDGAKRLNSIFDYESLFRFDDQKKDYCNRKKLVE